MCFASFLTYSTIILQCTATVCARACVLCRAGTMTVTVWILSVREQADLYTNPPSVSAAKVKSTERRAIMKKMKEWKPRLCAGGEAVWGWATERKWRRKAKTGEVSIMAGHTPVASQNNVITASEKGTKTKIKINKTRTMQEKKGFHIPLVPCFHGNHRCLWCRLRIFDKVAATQKKAKRG